MAVSFIGGGEETGVHVEPIDLSQVTDKLDHIMLYGWVHSPWAGFELTTVVVRGTDDTSSCKSNYDTITTTMAPDVCYRRSVWLGRNKIIDHTMLNRIQLYAIISNLKMKINLYA